jgi:hypothetical protein
MKEKCLRERKEKAVRRMKGKKDKAPRSMDDDYATNPLHGLYEGGRRCSMQVALGVKDFVTCPAIGLKKNGKCHQTRLPNQIG